LMIGMMMRNQNRGQHQPLTLEDLQDRRGISGIDNDR